MRTLELDDVIDALDSVTWYNGIADIIIGWKELPVDEHGIVCPGFMDKDLDVIWMICCVIFGDYGTSPRSGWITDVEGFYKFIDQITMTQQYHYRNPV